MKLYLCLFNNTFFHFLYLLSSLRFNSNTITLHWLLIASTNFYLLDTPSFYYFIFYWHNQSRWINFYFYPSFLDGILLKFENNLARLNEITFDFIMSYISSLLRSFYDISIWNVSKTSSIYIVMIRWIWIYIIEYFNQKVTILILQEQL